MFKILANGTSGSNIYQRFKSVQSYGSTSGAGDEDDNQWQRDTSKLNMHCMYCLLYTSDAADE